LKDFRNKKRDKKKLDDKFLKKRKKYCRFCVKEVEINYKDLELLQNFTTDKGKIRTRNSSGNCAKHQRKLIAEIKNARNMALLPFVTD